MSSERDTKELLGLIEQATPEQLIAISTAIMETAPQTVETFRALLRVIVTYPKKDKQ